MSDRFAGQVVVVAGGTGGLGRAVSAEFLGEGAIVVVTYRNRTELDVLQTEAGPNAHRLVAHDIDVTDEGAVRQMVEKIVAKHGRLDAVINSVGGDAAGSKLWDTQADVLDRMLSLNLFSVFVLLRATVPAMLKQGRGSIVNVASRAAIDHAGSAAAYAASKSAAVAMIDSLAEDLTGTNIRANSVLPSIIDTAANRRAIPNADFSRWPKPREIARVILFLCSDDARVIRGAAISV